MRSLHFSGILFLLLVSFASIENSKIVCIPGLCPVCGPLPRCSTNQELAPGFCGCCHRCVNVLNEEDSCYWPVQGIPPPFKCAEGLQCKDFICQKSTE